MPSESTQLWLMADEGELAAGQFQPEREFRDSAVRNKRLDLDQRRVGDDFSRQKFRGLAGAAIRTVPNLLGSEIADRPKKFSQTFELAPAFGAEGTFGIGRAFLRVGMTDEVEAHKD